VHLTVGADSSTPHVSRPTARYAELGVRFKILSQNISILLSDILQSHEERETLHSYIPAGKGICAPWILAIMGLKKEPTLQFVSPPLSELRRRIKLALDGALEKKRANSFSQLFSQSTGFLWQQLDDTFNVDESYLKVCSAFPSRLEKLLLESGKTLDHLAGVEVVKRYPKVEALVRDALSRGRKHGLEHVDLKLANGCLGGTVFALHNAHYSVEWIAAYLVDTDNNVFMQDVRAGALFSKERLLRIFSTNHTEDSPSWIQFGDKGSVYLYLSRLASAAEQGFLKIQSYIINLLIDDINKLLSVLGTHRKYRLEKYQFDVGVVGLGNPTTSSLAGHQDGKCGIVCPHTPGFSRFLLIVPTMAFQNNCGPTAKISWWRSDDPQKVKQATFTHDFFINHFQLMGVNDKFHHEV
jgi:hypothetical protein